MPMMDMTGPQGQGPMTGQGMGQGMGQQMPQQMPSQNASAGLGMAAQYIIKEHLRTKILLEKAKQARAYADAIEKAYQ